MGFSACGCIVDYAHICRVVPMRYVQGSNRTADVRFFFVREDAPTVPYPHHFLFSGWDDWYTNYNEGLGYIQTSDLERDRGRRPMELRERVCGARELWEEGQTEETPPEPMLNGWAECCLLGDLWQEDASSEMVGEFDLDEVFVSATEELEADAVGEFDLEEVMDATESLEADAVGEFDLDEAFEPAHEDVEFDGVGEFDDSETMEMVEEIEADAVGEFDLEEEFVPDDDGPISNDCSGVYTVPRILNFVSSEFCSGGVLVELTYSETAYLGGPGWYGSVATCDGKTLELWWVCLTTYWQLYGKCDGNSIGGASTSVTTYAPFYADGSGAFATGPGACADTFDAFWTITE